MFDLKRLTLLIALLVASTVTLVTAAVLSDPMRPSAGYAVSTAVQSERVNSQGDWVLQSVLVGAERAVAVIDGVPVSRGELYRGARLLKVQAGQVILQAKGGKKIVLKLTPGIHMKMVFAETEINRK